MASKSKEAKPKDEFATLRERFTRVADMWNDDRKRYKDDMRRNRNPTERELQVLKMVAAGCRYSEIGQILYIGERTVQNHVSMVMLKLNACNNHHAIAIALHRHLINASDIPQLEALGIFS